MSVDVIRLAVAPMAEVSGPVHRDEERAAADMAPWRAREFLRGRALLRGLAAETLGLTASEVVFSAEPRGRPRLRGHHAGVSVSHTDRHVAAAIWSGGEVGVDVMEPPAELDERLVKRCCGRWTELVLARRDRAACFARVWAVQEACAKAVGLGLAAVPWRIPADPDARSGRWRDVRWQRVDTGLPCALAVAVTPANATKRRSFGDPRVLVQHPG